MFSGTGSFAKSPRLKIAGMNCSAISKNMTFLLSPVSFPKDSSLETIKLMEKGNSGKMKSVAKMGATRYLKPIRNSSGSLTVCVCIITHQPTLNYIQKCIKKNEIILLFILKSLKGLRPPWFVYQTGSLFLIFIQAHGQALYPSSTCGQLIVIGKNSTMVACKIFIESF